MKSVKHILARTGWRYAAMAILPLLVLVYAPVANFLTLALGTPILLETRPIDPRDILRGDYVRLEYEISNIANTQVPEDVDEKPEPVPVFVRLELDEKGVASVLNVSLYRPKDGIYLKGRLESHWKSYSCDYGLGVYYVPEGTGRELERAIEDSKVLADVRVLRGRGVIRKLMIED